MTYGELRARADQLGRKLVAEAAADALEIQPLQLRTLPGKPEHGG